MEKFYPFIEWHLRVAEPFSAWFIAATFFTMPFRLSPEKDSFKKGIQIFTTQKKEELSTQIEIKFHHKMERVLRKTFLRR